MDSNNTSHNNELLSKLTRLEDQVASLTQQLDTDKSQIGHLKQLLSDRDNQIKELETKLIAVQGSLQPSVLGAIALCREQIKKGIDTNIINPVVLQIQKSIDTLQQFTEEVNAFIAKGKNNLSGTINTTSDLLRKTPDQVKALLDERALKPLHEAVDKAYAWSSHYYHESLKRYERESVERVQAISKRMNSLIRELPLDAKIIVQTRVIDPVWVQMDNVPGLLNQFAENTQTWLKQTIEKIQQILRDILDYIADLIKKSSFWDGKQRVAGAT